MLEILHTNVADIKWDLVKMLLKHLTRLCLLSKIVCWANYSRQNLLCNVNMFKKLPSNLSALQNLPFKLISAWSYQNILAFKHKLPHESINARLSFISMKCSQQNELLRWQWRMHAYWYSYIKFIHTFKRRWEDVVGMKLASVVDCGNFVVW